MSPTLTTWYSVRNGLVKPLSLGSRMCSGICPPSKAAGTFLRALVPLVPRPAVLPLDAFTTTDAGLLGLGSRRRTQVMQFDGHR